MQKRIYLDHNATTPIHAEVREVIASALEDCTGNPSSIHQEGQKARMLLEKARLQTAHLLNAKREEIYFTSGGTESNNIALFSYLESSATGDFQREVITLPVEHPSILSPLRHLEKQHKIKLKYLSLDAEGRLDLNQLEDSLNDQTALVSVMLVNNEVGTRYPIEEVARICRNRPRPIPVHCDGIQAAGRLSVFPRHLGVTSFSLSGHKFYGPKGVGALWIDSAAFEGREWLRPRQFGGGQEAGLRSGTENLPGILGFGKACELAEKYQKAWQEKIEPLRNLLEAKLMEKVSAVRINAKESERIYSTSNLHFAGVPGDVLQQALDLAGIAVSTGSACSSGTVSGSHVLKALGQSEQTSREAIRVSLGIQNTKEEILYLVDTICGAIKRIRESL